MITVTRLTVAAAAEEPITVAALRAYGRITDPEETDTLEALIAAAREETERLTGRILVPGTFRIDTGVTDAITRAQFPIAPVTSIDSVVWVSGGDLLPDVPGAAVHFDYARGLLNVTFPDPTIVPLIAWPTVFVGRPGPPARRHREGSTVAAVEEAGAGAPLMLRVEVTAGYATPDEVPEGIRQHVLTLALLRYQHRDDPEALARAAAFAASGISSFGVVQV